MKNFKLPAVTIRGFVQSAVDIDLDQMAQFIFLLNFTGILFVSKLENLTLAISEDA